MHPYQYRPLECNDSIRLLVLHPSSNQSDSILCTIQHTRHSDALLKYDALSYTWGDATQKRAIYFDDGSGELLVTENCHNALRRLRYTHAERMLWVDAICINQEDLKERASQVRMMNRIFELAFNVMVFLGEPNPRISILLEELAAADEMILCVGYCDRPPPSEVVIQQLEELFQNSWFKRVWVLQEVCAKEDFVAFMCGSTRFSYSSLQKLYMGYSRNVVTKEYWPLTTQWIRHPPEKFSTPQFSLWNRLGESRNYLATDPRDRVFALKSLLGPEQSQMDHLINYAQSVEECFIQIALFLLPVLGLRLLTAARHPHEKNMPSWIPDWSQTLPLHFWNFHREFLEFSLSVPCIDGFKEQRYALCPFSGRSNDIFRELRVTGCRYAQISKTTQVFQFNNVEDARRQLERLYYSLENLRHFVDTESMTCDEPTMYLPLDEAIIQTMVSMCGYELDSHLRRGFDSGPATKLNLAHPQSMRDLFASLQKCRIGLMDNGQLVIVPEAVQVGDVICLLSGAISPCAIRSSSNGSWRLISGDCYIFTDDFQADRECGFFMCNDYIAHTRHILEEFILR